MNIAKEPPYVPSPFTLTLMDNFGLRRSHRNKQTTSMSHYKSEARLKPAIDKEALLQQLRQQRAKERHIKASTGYLRRQLSHTKPAGLVASRSCMEVALKREIEAMASKIEQQNAQIMRIKTSKKYNRFIELLTAKDVYQEQLTTATTCTARNKQALREGQRMWREHHRRQKDTQAMDEAVRIQIAQENNTISNQIQHVEAQIKAGLRRQITQAREKQRLIKEILELQKITGKLFIVEGQQEEDHVNEEKDYENCQEENSEDEEEYENESDEEEYEDDTDHANQVPSEPLRQPQQEQKEEEPSETLQELQQKIPTVEGNKRVLKWKNRCQSSIEGASDPSIFRARYYSQ